MKVRISKASEDVPREFLCSLLYAFLKGIPQNCEEKLESEGFLELDLTEEEIRALREAKIRYPFFNLEVLEVIFEGHQNKTYSIFSESWEFLKAKGGFFALFSLTLLVMLLLSLLPTIGFLFKIVSILLIYSCVLYLIDYFSNKQEEEIVLGKVWDYIAPSLGLYLGSTVFWLLAPALFFILFITSVGFGTLINLMQGKESWENVLEYFGVVILLILVLLLYYFYAMPLVYAKMKEEGMNFPSGLISAFYPFSPKGFSEAFKSSYLKLAGLWLSFSTIVYLLALLCILSIILIPVGFTLLCWWIVYTALTVNKILESKAMD